jgi:hypothetical protein
MALKGKLGMRGREERNTNINLYQSVGEREVIKMKKYCGKVALH